MVKVASTKIQPWTTNYPCQRFYGHKWMGPFDQALASPGICIGGPAGVRRAWIGPGVRREISPPIKTVTNRASFPVHPSVCQTIVPSADRPADQVV